MTVKTRISLLVIGAGLISSLLFSIVVFFESIEQPFDILDKVLKDEAIRITKMITEKQDKVDLSGQEMFSNIMYPYWIRIVDQKNNNILYKSNMVNLIDLPTIRPGDKVISSIHISRGKVNLHQGWDQEVTFRIRAFLIPWHDRSLAVQIARPMEKLEDEIWELVFGIGAGLILSCMALIAISRFIAGRILKPIGEMKELTKNISEKNLNRRIPAGPEQDEFNELARTINRMLDRLQNSFIKQRTFLFDTSHELKTPLTTMRLAIDELYVLEETRLPISVQENLSRLNNQVLRMERMVKDLLSLSSLETLTGIDLKGVNIEDLLSFLIADYLFIAEAQNVTMDIILSDDLTIQGDHDKLSRMFSNLLDNAIKYNTEYGRIKVEGKRSNNSVIIKIGNTGPGVPVCEAGKVFDQFYRVEKSRSHKHGGYGLGLAIVKKIVELHNGNIEFNSNPEVWTEVTVCLPVHQKDIPA